MEAITEKMGCPASWATHFLCVRSRTFSALSAALSAGKFQLFTNVLFNAGFHIIGFHVLERLTGNLLKEFNITFGNLFNKFIAHIGYILSFLSLETFFNEPFSDEFLGQLPLGLSLLESFLITIGIKVTG